MIESTEPSLPSGGTVFLIKTFKLGSVWKFPVLTTGEFRWFWRTGHDCKNPSGFWCHVDTFRHKKLSRKNQEFSIYSEIRSFSSGLETKRSLDGSGCEKSLVYIILTVLGNLFFVCFYGCFMLAELCWTKSLEGGAWNIWGGLAAEEHFCTDQKTGWRRKEDLFS